MWKIAIFKETVGATRTVERTGDYLNDGKEYSNRDQARAALIDHINGLTRIIGEEDVRSGCYWYRLKPDDAQNVVLCLERVFIP
jgi:hypothetical protein